MEKELKKTGANPKFTFGTSYFTFDDNGVVVGWGVVESIEFTTKPSEATVPDENGEIVEYHAYQIVENVTITVTHDASTPLPEINKVIQINNNRSGVVEKKKFIINGQTLSPSNTAFTKGTISGIRYKNLPV